MSILFDNLYMFSWHQQMTPWELSRFTISWLVSTWKWRKREREKERKCRATIRTVCSAKFTKFFLFKYAAITSKADWCIRLCVCFDSRDVLRAVTVSLLANYYKKQMGKVSCVGEEEASHMLKIRCGDTVCDMALLPWKERKIQTCVCCEESSTKEDRWVDG